MSPKEKIILILAEHYCRGEFDSEFNGCAPTMQCVKDCGKFDTVAQEILDVIYNKQKEDDRLARRIRCSD